MRLFNTLSIEITARCNRQCNFCPVAYNTRPEERMEQALIDQAFLELGGLRYRGRIEFYIYNEPLRDKGFLITTLAQARKQVPRACLMIATNGDYIRSHIDITNLFDNGLNQLLINCYSPGLYQRRQPWLDALPPTISREKSVYAVLGSRTKTVQMLDKSDSTKFGSGVFRIINRVGNIQPFAAALNKPVARMCVKPFRILNINWRGEALLCCNDYHGDVEVGNLRTSSLVQMWNGPVLNEYRRRLLLRDRTLPLCSKCDCHAGAYPHNVQTPKGKFANKQSITEAYQRRLKQREN